MMETIQILKTNGALGYNEWAYLLKIAEDQYLCVELDARPRFFDSYEIGKMISDGHKDMPLELVNLDVRQTRWYERDPFLAEYFLTHEFGGLQNKAEQLKDFLRTAGLTVKE
jgi:hypothetical protein